MMARELCHNCRYHVVVDTGPVLALNDQWQTEVIAPRSEWIGCCAPIPTAKVQHGERPGVTMLKEPVTKCLMFRKSGAGG